MTPDQALADFRAWCVKVGHYQAVIAVDHYLKAAKGEDENV